MAKTLRVLNVEDSPQDVMLLTRHLTAQGYEVVSDRVDTAHALEAALAACEWDIILCDYSMPAFNALAALAVLHESGLDIPFIIISGTVGEEIAVEAMLTGANDYLAKNNLTRLVPAIERELNEAANRKARRLAERSLTRSEAELRALFAAMNDEILVIDADGRHLKVAPTTPGHPVAPAPERLGKTLHDLFPAEQADLFLETIRQALAEDSTQQIEYSLPFNGQEIWFEGSVSPMSRDSVIWVARDITERKHAEEKIRQGEGQLREAQRLARVGSWNWDLVTDTLTWSEGNFHIYGLQAGDIDPSYYPAVEEMIFPDDRSLVRSVLENARQTLESFSFHYRVVHADGSVHLIHSRGKMVGDERGRAVRMYGTAQDVTELNRAREEQERLNTQLEKERTRLKNVVASVPGIVWESWNEPDPQKQRIDFVSDYVYPMLGYTVEEWLATPNFWLSIVHPDDHARATEASVLRTTSGKLDHSLEFRWVAKDGRVIWVQSNSAVILDDERPVGLRGVTIDITERKRSERALGESEERYREMVENAIDIIYTHDLEGNYTSVNRAGQIITGYTTEECLNLNIAASIAPEFLEKAREMISLELAGKDVPAYELELVAKDGRHIAVEANTRIIYENGRPVGVQGIARDITERKQLEEQLLQSQKMEAVGLLAGGIAHDFNNLLTAISGYSELTLKKMDAGDPLRHNIIEVKNAGDRAAALTGQLLAFSRKQVLKPRVHNLNSIIANIERMLRRIIKENVELRTVLDPQLGNIKADPGQIEQVIMNLAVNARDAMPRGGTLTIETTNVELTEREINTHLSVSPGLFVKMSVTDTGEGIEEHVQRRIFEPFFTTKPLGKGSGLGLSTAHGIIRQSGGDILADSVVGEGTTFEIYLPCVDERVQRPKWIDDNEEDHSGTETILLVEDDDIVRNLVREILVAANYEVLESSSGKQALEICKSYDGAIDLLLTDVIMPQMSGTELMEDVIQLRPDIKVLFMSGYTDDSIAHSGILESDTAFIEKPFTPDALSKKIRMVLET